MKYMLMIYQNADVWNDLPEQEQQAVMSEGGRRWQELVATGEGIMGEPLANPADARIVRVRNGFPDVTDGPFVDANEQFVGFLIVDVVDEKRAVEIASSWPDGRYSALEVRLIHVENAT